MPLTVLAMSGGVDSSVSARLLLDAGHELVGVFMRHGEHSPAAACAAPASPAQLPILSGGLSHKQGCCSASDAEDARQVAESLDIPFYALNLQKEFDRIVEYFVDEYHRGRTPNPCVMCNNWIKFGKLFAYADSLGADFVATGHYARLADDGGEPRLLRGIDAAKDQSYVLFGVHPPYLSRMRLPVGTYRKSEIRAIAREMGLRIADKRDSQEICFVTSGHHAEFVRARASSVKAGRIVTTDGTVVGSHEGIERFTIGQRKGLGVALGEPHFVVHIDPQSCDVTIGKKEALATRRLVASQANWICDVPDAFDCDVQIRYNSRAVPAHVRRQGPTQFDVAFAEPCFGVAPGQAAVCYRDSQVLGGGWIDRQAHA